MSQWVILSEADLQVATYAIISSFCFPPPPSFARVIDLISKEGNKREEWRKKKGKEERGKEKEDKEDTNKKL